MKKSTINKLRKRDLYCLHCGEDRAEMLVPHHRKNRGMGGSKLLDRLDNLLLICADYNGLMESSPAIADNAREYGHKLESWQDFVEPIFDECDGEWYVLTESGEKNGQFPSS
jgi:hypothetical protein